MSAVAATALRRVRVAVHGCVQGVGFRPFVYRRAAALGLTGWVANANDGVSIEAQGDAMCIDRLLDALRNAAPRHATVEAIDATDAPLRNDERCFEVRASALDAGTTRMPADVATCDACLAELFDPSNRRSRYPFINCTQCGPRYSIIEALPYDRERTTMRAFVMCDACRAEFDDPYDRRFHAQPNACAACGPRLALWDAAGATLARDDAALRDAAAALRHGAIVAVKGIGGLHLFVDARSDTAVERLRERKRREAKPLAVMFASLDDVARECVVGTREREVLCDAARPIVLLRRRGTQVAAAVAPGNPWLGALLPYAGAHHLLLRDVGFPLVATSANVSDEPIVADERAALARLRGVADLWLVHDRPIARPIDDSVARVVCDRPLLLRRGRGYAGVVPLAGAKAGVLGLGGHLKTTLAVTDAGAVVVGPHVGDLTSVAARDAYAAAVADVATLAGSPVRVVAHDPHPDYASTQVAARQSLPTHAVPHHLAHVAACMADNDAAPPLLGVAWDGAGYGGDGTIWGGEFLQVTASGWRRVAHLRPFRLPGGEAAMREPWRSACGLLFEAFGERAFEPNAAAMAELPAHVRTALRTMLARGVNAPWTSSVGRLFDAFAALCGLRRRAQYEGQAAAQLEWAADGFNEGRAYPFDVGATTAAAPLIVDWRPALVAALADLAAGVPVGAVSAALHAGLVDAIVAVAARVGERRVALTGGCFQNARLTTAAVTALRGGGFEPLWHRRVPPNDGGLALGQAAWVARYAPSGERTCA